MTRIETLHPHIPLLRILLSLNFVQTKHQLPTLGWLRLLYEYLIIEKEFMKDQY